MKNAFVSLFILVLFSSFTSDSFKSEQLKYSRVRLAYKEKEAGMLSNLKKHSIIREDLRLYLRVFKQEKEIELWAKNNSEKTFQHIQTYKVCRTIGKPGPKRKQGDHQIPEGFYHINIFNPYSNFYLSLGVNYPNKSDRILGVKGKLGGDIFIHGACVTIGCVPITDDKIKELYIYCVEARNSGQSKIPVTIFPAKMTQTNVEKLKSKYSHDKDRIGLWTDLKKGFELFNKTKQLPNIAFLSTGRHEVKE